MISPSYYYYYYYIYTSQLFQRRAKYVRDNERKWWNQLTPDFMSEESDGDDKEFVVHKPEWRSEGMV